MIAAALLCMLVLFSGCNTKNSTGGDPSAVTDAEGNVFETVKTRAGVSLFYEREEYRLESAADHPALDRGVRMNTRLTLLLHISETASFSQRQLYPAKDHRGT